MGKILHNKNIIASSTNHRESFLSWLTFNIMVLATICCYERLKGMSYPEALETAGSRRDSCFSGDNGVTRADSTFCCSATSKWTNSDISLSTDPMLLSS